MKKTVLIFIAICLTTNVKGQKYKYEAGVNIGVNAFIGDIGKSFPVFNGNSISVFGSYLLNDRYTLKLQLDYSYLSAKTSSFSKAKKDSYKNSFVNNLFGGSALIEFNFFEPYVISWKYAQTPYIYLGVSFFSHTFLYNQLSIESDFVISYNTIFSTGMEFTIGIPFGIGYKFQLNEQWQIGVKSGITYTFTDAIDSSNIPLSFYHKNLKNRGLYNIADSKINLNVLKVKKEKQFGNLNNNDMFFDISFSITYLFGEKPCACGQ